MFKPSITTPEHKITGAITHESFSDEPVHHLKKWMAGENQKTNKTASQNPITNGVLGGAIPIIMPTPIPKQARILSMGTGVSPFGCWLFEGAREGIK